MRWIRSGIVAAWFALGWWVVSPPARAARPNLVVILADDLGWGDPRCNNPASRIPTPHLDRLAREGVRFTDAHAPSAVCTPTRYGLLTGRYAWRTRLTKGVLWGYSPPLIEPGRVTLPELLRRQGYATLGVGKWHLGLQFATRQPAEFGDLGKPAADPALIDWQRPFVAGPHTAGFEQFFGIPASLDMEPYFFIHNDRAWEPPLAWTQGSRSQREGGEGFWRAGPRAPGFTIEGCQTALADRAVRHVHEAATTKRPFFLYLALTSPHDPWVPTTEFRGKSGAGPRGDFVMETDHVVGRVLRALDESGAASNTLVVFTSDNGAHWLPKEVESTGHAANGGWRGMKSDAWEGGHRVPLLVRWPGRIRAGTASDALVGLNDLYATLAEVIGARVPAGAAEDSVSFRRALLGRHQPARPPLVLHAIDGTFALRDGPWKFIEGSASGGWTAGRVNTPGQLYRLDLDGTESANAWSEAPDRVVRMQHALDRVRHAHGPTRTR